MNKIIKFTSQNKELIKQAFDIRTHVFVIEQKVENELEYDEFDESADHYLCYCNDIPAGTSRRRVTDEGIKLERLAVLKEYRGKGIGGELMQQMMNDVLPTEKKIYLNAQADVTDVYKKYGFRIVGTMFYEAGIRHYKMVYTP